MKIAVTYENGAVFQHFGHTSTFKIYEAENGAVVSESILDAAGSGHGALAGFLKAHGVETLICCGIGGGAKTALAEAGIQLYPGVNGPADDAVRQLLAGTLAFDLDTACSHHHGDGAHGEGNAGCGGDGHHHGCGGSHS